MLTTNPDALVLLIVVIAIISGVLTWKKLISKNSKLTFDNAEKLFIYVLGGVLILTAIYLQLAER